MHYKTIVLEFLRERTELHEQLRKSDRLLPALETYAQELKNSHEVWKETLFLMRPGSEPSQIASEAMEMAMKELVDRLPSASQEEDQEPLSLDAAMAFIRRPTSRGYVALIRGVGCWAGRSLHRTPHKSRRWRCSGLDDRQIWISNREGHRRAHRMARSANLDFFAAEADQRAVLDFMFSSTDVRVFESYSECGTELREFRSTDELAATFPIGKDPHGNGYALVLQLWSPSVMRELSISRITLNPAACDGHTFRYRIDGGGLIQLYMGGVCERVVTKSHYGHQSQIRAQAWEVDDGVNWESLKTLSNRIQYHIRKRLAAGKAGSMPVLPQALELARAGHALKLATQTPWAFDLQPLSKQAKPGRAAADEGM